MVTAMNDHNRSQRFAIGVVFSLLCFAGSALGAGDPNRGAQVFQACMACHSIKPGEHMTGPSLANIWGHKAGTIEKFLRYSDAMKRADVIWNDATLDKWLSDPDRSFIYFKNFAMEPDQIGNADGDRSAAGSSRNLARWSSCVLPNGDLIQVNEIWTLNAHRAPLNRADKMVDPDQIGEYHDCGMTHPDF